MSQGPYPGTARPGIDCSVVAAAAHVGEVSDRLQALRPDVYLVDGGIGQISSVAKELENFKPRPHLLSLAKREETLYRWTGSRAEEVRLEKSAPALRLLMYVRDEAHRFAQHYHHLLRRKAIMDEAAR